MLQGFNSKITIQPVQPVAVDAPATDELLRARELAGCLAFAISQTKIRRLSRVSLSIADAEELCQLLHDSLRTAEHLKKASNERT